MTGTPLLRVFDLVYLAAASAWVGGAIVYLFVLAPAAKDSRLGFGAGGLRAIAPKFFGLAAAASALTLPADVCGSLTTPELRSPMVLLRAGLLIAGVLTWLYAANTLAPAWQSAAADPSKSDRAARLAKRASIVTAIGLVLGLGALAAFAYRPWPTTAGLTEPNPRELFRLRAEAAARRAEATTRPLEPAGEPPDRPD